MKVMLFILLIIPFVWAGWEDLILDSPEHMHDFHQGNQIILSLNVTYGVGEGAVYITNLTLYPPPCVNMGQPIFKDVGIILCPHDDQSCQLGFRKAVESVVLRFENLTTDRSCISGVSEYYFIIEGSSELMSGTGRWSGKKSTSSKHFKIRFVGPTICGDGRCEEGEDCGGCPEDCGACPECQDGARICLNNSVVECQGGFFINVIERCKHGCVMENNTPFCRRICREGSRRCMGDTLQRCVENEWINQTCQYGCVNDTCITNPCAGVVCEARCENGTAYWDGLCDIETGECIYYSSRECEYGCDGVGCAPAPTKDEGMEGACPSILFLTFLLLVMNKNEGI